MRLCYITTVYGSYLDSFYKDRPELLNASYAVQNAALLDDGFGRLGALSATLPMHGYEVKEIVGNAIPMQDAWARENGFDAPVTQKMTSIVQRQVLDWKPDVIFFDDPINFSSGFIAELRARCGSIKVILGYNGAPTYNLDTVRQYDVLLNPTRAWVASFERQGCNCRFYPHAFNTNFLHGIPEREPVEAEVLFIGALVRAHGYHLVRERTLEALAAKLPIRIHSPSAAFRPVKDALETATRCMLYDGIRLVRRSKISTAWMERLPVLGKASKWDQRPMRQVNPRLRPYLRPPLFGRAFYAAQRKSAITLNILADIGSEMGAINMRLFEATGVGACLLTDASEDLKQVFDVDREVVTFATPDECIQKAKWLLDHPKEREDIAKAGQARTLRNYTCVQRAEQLNGIIGEVMAKA